MIRRSLPLALPLILVACSTAAPFAEPSLAPRAAEAIDPRVPVPDGPDAPAADAALVARLNALTAEAIAAAPAFDADLATARRLAAVAGPKQSEGWIAAQQALSQLVERNGVTTRVAADIDALAAMQLQQGRWIAAGDRAAILAAQARVGAIGDVQAAAIDALGAQLAR